ncbi:hypothetical protein [Pseudoduganella violaceinigra]|uniref:hypothetical protein n=1 Tax=Pseudoduganella violaceinigra TaxID=246602 RepID=UPI001B7FD224|nr:hypothetical protein [Pseudoduganella violaceinigra]
MTACINANLASYSAEIKPSVHFGLDRLNDLRNKPPINAVELEGVFMRFLAQHIDEALKPNDGETFNIRCLQTIMRRKNFFAKDSIEFRVV